MLIPTKAEKRRALLESLPPAIQVQLGSALHHFDQLRELAREAGYERSFLNAVASDITGYGSVKDSHDPVQPGK